MKDSCANYKTYPEISTATAKTQLRVCIKNELELSEYFVMEIFIQPPNSYVLSRLPINKDEEEITTTSIQTLSEVALKLNGMMEFFQSNPMLHPSHDHQDDQHHPQQHPNPSAFHQILPLGADSKEFYASLLGKRSSMSFPGVEAEAGEGGEDGSPGGEKKRRLSVEQVKTLEKNFKLGKKLEPERKMLLAKVLGLQPRQIAIWFQNRRARWKTKQLEKVYDLLKWQFEVVKADNKALQDQNQKFHAGILSLKNREPAESINLKKEMDQGSSSNLSENSSEIKLDITRSFQVIETPFSLHQLFPSTITPVSGSEHHLFPASPTYASKEIEPTVKEENNITNMFCVINDQSRFWPWLDQHHFN